MKSFVVTNIGHIMTIMEFEREMKDIGAHVTNVQFHGAKREITMDVNDDFYPGVTTIGFHELFPHPKITISGFHSDIPPPIQQ